MTNTFILGSKDSDFYWNITLGEKSSFSFDIVEDETLKPLSLESWNFRVILFNSEDHMLYELDYDVDGNTITFFVSEDVTSVLSRPKHRKETVLSFDVEGYGPGFDMEKVDNDPKTWTYVTGTVIVTDPNQ